MAQRTQKKFVDIKGAKTIADQINTLALGVGSLLDKDHIQVISEVDFANLTEKEPNTQYNIVGKAIEFGEIQIYNNETGAESFVSINSLMKMDPSKITPIGIVVIPSSHNVYGDGTPGVMALKYASASTPDTGGNGETISWGEYGTLDLPELPNLTTAPSLKWSPSIMPEHTSQQTESGYICGDDYTLIENPFDTARKWSTKNGTHCASAFKEDGSCNTEYSVGCLSDFDGLGNTAKFVADTTKTFAAIDAVLACGDGWYMPAVGELGYVASNKKLLNQILTAAGCAKIENQSHWTSSKLNTSNARQINMSNGQVTYSGGNSAYLVRPFRKVSGIGSIGQFWNGTGFVDTYDSSCVGIVVIPSSHNVYGDGSCGVMSLKYATASGFGSAVGIKIYAFDASTNNGVFVPSSITTSYNCIGVDGMAQISFSELGSPEGTIYIPSDAFTGQLSADGKAKYYYNSGPFGPSPYTETGAKNPLFFGQCLADFNGKSNSEAILSHVTLGDWQTSTTINNPTISNGGNQSMPIGEFPAACCCWRYRTVGTNQGDWYLPAEGELAYACTRRSSINEILTQINAWKSGSAATLNNSWYWSSTEYSTWFARYVYFSNGRVDDTGRYFRYYVRPFRRVSV